MHRAKDSECVVHGHVVSLSTSRHRTEGRRAPTMVGRLHKNLNLTFEPNAHVPGEDILPD